MSFNSIGNLYKLCIHRNNIKLSHLRRYHLPQKMKCLHLNNYGNSIAELDTNSEIPCPTERDLKSDQALVKVHAASVNPLDIVMAYGYGRNAINLLRKTANIPEFPLILGRDFSGIIVKRGKKFRRFQIGEPVYGVRWVVGHGTHAEYAVVNKSEICPKPNNIDFMQAASLPFIACTTWSALINSGTVAKNENCKRILIPGGSGGIGSFAVQLCQLYGHDVITTCAADAIRLLQDIGIKNIVDYKSDSYDDDLRNAGPFDVILDTLNEKYIKFFQQLLKQTSTSQYISLRPSLLPDTDKRGLIMGIASSGGKFVQSTINQLSSGKGVYQWGFFNPNSLILNNLKEFIEDGRIRPVIDKTFDIKDALDAYRYVESGHARGKTVITMVE